MDDCAKIAVSYFIVGIDGDAEHNGVALVAALLVVEGGDLQQHQEFPHFHNFLAVELLVLVHVLFGVEDEALPQHQVDEFVGVLLGREYRYADVLLPSRCWHVLGVVEGLAEQLTEQFDD